MAKGEIGKKLVKYVSNYVVFDLETTGINPSEDEVIEISGLKVKNGKITDEFTSLVHPGKRIPYSATVVNQITNAMVADAPDFSVVLKKFLDFAGDMILVGHNIHTFDMKFLWRDAERYYHTIIENDYIDTLTLARMYLKKLKHHKLTDLAEYYGISSQGAHRALHDCRMNQQIFELLGKEIRPEKIRSDGGKICTACGSIMIRRRGKFGEFWGCGSFPACRNTEKI